MMICEFGVIKEGDRSGESCMFQSAYRYENAGTPTVQLRTMVVEPMEPARNNILNLQTT